MPEYTECFVSGSILQAFLSSALQNGWPIDVLSLEADATTAESARFPRSSRFSAGLVDAISCTCNFKRGCTNAQTPLYPPQFTHTSKQHTRGPCDIQARGLQLKAIQLSPRTVIIDMAAIVLQIQLLTHTMCQVYTQDEYQNAIRTVPRQRRGFRVGLAIVFAEHTIVFATLDLVFQCHWATSIPNLPYQHLDIYLQFNEVLERFVAWMERMSKRSNLDILALSFLRKDDETRLILGGLGLYTAGECAFLSAIPPYLTLAQLLQIPSLCARLLDSFFCLGAKTHEEIMDWMKPHLNGFKVAIRRETRLEYAARLHVHAKHTSFMSARAHAILVNQDYDPFEPTYLKAAFTRTPEQGPILAHLILGREGCRKFAPELLSNFSDQKDPLTAYFARRGLLDTSTRLNISMYDTLYLGPSELRARKAPTYYYKRGRDAIWSVFPPPGMRYSDAASQEEPDLPFDPAFDLDDSIEDADNDEKEEIVNYPLASEDVRAHALFTHIVRKTALFAIGPLDYCGIAHKVRK